MIAALHDAAAETKDNPGVNEARGRMRWTWDFLRFYLWRRPPAVLERRTTPVVRARRIGNPFIEQFCTVIILRTSLVFLTKGVSPIPKKHPAH
jgi:hypothetical protein